MATKATTVLLLLAAAAALLCDIHGSVVAVVAGGEGDEPCDPSDITIMTEKTGRVVGGLPEYRVTIGNECACPQGDMVVSCLDGIPSGVDRSKIHIATKDSLCLVNDGLQIVKGSPVVFTYAANAAISLIFNAASPPMPLTAGAQKLGTGPNGGGSVES